MLETDEKIKVGIAGLGAIGSAVARALVQGIEGYILHAGSDPREPDEFPVIYTDFQTLAKECDLIIECLPPSAVPELMPHIFAQNKSLIMISPSALLIYPEIKTEIEMHKRSKKSRVIIPSGALCGLDGVQAMAQIGIKSSKIISTKPPHGYREAPYIVQKSIDLDGISSKTLLFSGNAYEATKAFPANVNVAASLSLSGSGPEHTQVEIWADPGALCNSHEIVVESAHSRLTAKIENMPDPQNPKSSILAAQSIISLLRKKTQPLIVL